MVCGSNLMVHSVFEEDGKMIEWKCLQPEEPCGNLAADVNGSALHGTVMCTALELPRRAR